MALGLVQLQNNRLVLSMHTTNSLFDSFIKPNSHDWAASRQNQQNGMCAQWRLRSAWTSAQSDQSLRCPHEESLSP